MKALKKFLTVLTISTLGFAFTSNAALITVWDYEVDSAFTAFAPGAVVGSDQNTFWTAPTTLSWGNSSNSSLVIGSSNPNGNSTGMASTNGALVQTSTMTHNNFVINGTTLDNATLSSRLTLTPNTPAGPALTPLDLVFGINFLETVNAEPCVVGSVIPCRDIFAISPVGPFNQGFVLDGYNYNIELIVDGLGPLSDEACTAAFGVATSGCEGFTTIEGQANNFAVNMRITAIQTTSIPEPSTILLLSLALFGIVASSRGKHS